MFIGYCFFLTFLLILILYVWIKKYAQIRYNYAMLLCVKDYNT